MFLPQPRHVCAEITTENPTDTDVIINLPIFHDSALVVKRRKWKEKVPLFIITDLSLSVHINVNLIRQKRSNLIFKFRFDNRYFLFPSMDK